MTSTSVSNMLMANVSNAALDQTNTSASKTDGDFDLNFSKALNAVGNLKASDTSSSLNVTTKRSTDVSVSVTKNSVKNSRLNQKKIKDESTEQADGMSEEDLNSVAEQLKDFENDVKDAIKEALGVTDEEIDDAMETLNLTVIDLVDPGNLANLFLNLGGQSDSVSLVLDGDFSELMTNINDLFENLLDQVNLNPAQLQEISISLNSYDEIQINVKLPEEDENPIDEGVSDETLATTDEELVQSSVNTNEISDDTEVDEADEGKILETVSVEETDETEDTSKDSSDNFLDSKSKEPEIESAGRDDLGVEMNEPKFSLSFEGDKEVVELPSGQRVYVEDMIDQIVDKAQIFSTSESTTMEMTLNPEGLGKIFMEVTQKGDEVTAKIFTENEVVKEALDSQMASLRTQLNDSSTKITSIEVSVGTHEFERNLDEGQEEGRQAQDEAAKRQSRRTKIDLSSLDGLSGLMTEEEELVYQMMKDNGNSLDYHA